MKKSRRDFLKQAIVGSASLVAHRAFGDGQIVAPNIEYCDAIVIGAGMAGLTAARDLTYGRVGYNPLPNAAGLKTILLEGDSKRIGGRIFTMGHGESKEAKAERELFGGPIELGAEYIHRSRGSVSLWDDVDVYGIKTETINRFNDGLMYFDGWENNLRSELGAGIKWMFEDFKITDLAGTLWKKAFFYNRINDYKGIDISAKDWLDRQNFSNLGRNLVDLYFTGHIPGHLNKISIKGFASDNIAEQELETEEHGFPDGYAQFLDRMRKFENIKQSKVTRSDFRVDLNSTTEKYYRQKREIDIRLGATVNYISYKPNAVEVRTTDGRIFRAKAAVITASVGMLKSNMIEFNPPLPQDKLDALHVMGMGDEAKMVLKFKKRFWADDAVILNRIDQNYEMCRTYFVPFSKHPEINKTLVMLWAGAEADKIAQMPDDEVIPALIRDMNKMFPKEAKEAGGSLYNLLEMNSDGTPLRRTYQWSLDGLAKGSDSYLIAGNERSVPVTSARRVLASPLTTPGLFWAGEATAIGEGTQPCSTHGAHFSGGRAAVEVMFYLRQWNEKPWFNT